jgi:lysophospholipase L1-like esterase
MVERNPNPGKVDATLVNTYNGIGLRGPEYPEQPERFVKVFTVGGSTTACVTLTDGKTWPDHLFRRLQAARPDVWLNNAGMNGHSTHGHRILLEQHLRKLSPDYLVFLVGVNDVGRSDLNDFDRAMAGQTVSLRNRIVAASELLSTIQVLYRSSRALDLGVNFDFTIDFAKLPRQPMEPGARERELERHQREFLPAYRERIDDLVLRSREIGAEPVLLTQPALLGDAVDPTTGVELGPLRFSDSSSSSVQWAVLELYNDVLRDVARARGVALVDLAREMPKDSAYYTDWIHFSNAGAEKVGEIVALGLLPQLR